MFLNLNLLKSSGADRLNGRIDQLLLGRAWAKFDSLLTVWSLKKIVSQGNIFFEYQNSSRAIFL